MNDHDRRFPIDRGDFEIVVPSPDLTPGYRDPTAPAGTVAIVRVGRKKNRIFSSVSRYVSFEEAVRLRDSLDQMIHERDRELWEQTVAPCSHKDYLGNECGATWVEHQTPTGGTHPFHLGGVCIRCDPLSTAKAPDLRCGHLYRLHDGSLWRCGRAPVKHQFTDHSFEWVDGKPLEVDRYGVPDSLKSYFSGHPNLHAGKTPIYVWGEPSKEGMTKAIDRIHELERQVEHLVEACRTQEPPTGIRRSYLADIFAAQSRFEDQHFPKWRTYPLVYWGNALSGEAGKLGLLMREFEFQGGTRPIDPLLDHSRAMQDQAADVAIVFVNTCLAMGWTPKDVVEAIERKRYINEERMKARHATTEGGSERC